MVLYSKGGGCDTSKFQTLNLITYFIIFVKQQIIDPSDPTQKLLFYFYYFINKRERGNTREVGLLEDKIHGSKVNHQVTAKGGQVVKIC